MKKILSIILCLSMLMSSVAFAAPVNMAPIDVESAVEETLAGPEIEAELSAILPALAPVSTYPENGAADVSLGDIAYKVTFDKAVKAEDVTLENLASDYVGAIHFDKDTNTVYLFPKTEYKNYTYGYDVGTTFSFPEIKSNIPTADGQNSLYFPAVSYTIGMSHGDDGENMVPYGNMEYGFIPIASAHVTAIEEEDGNHYVSVTKNPSSGNKNWIYIYAPVHFEPNTEYKYSYNVKALEVVPAIAGVDKSAARTTIRYSPSDHSDRKTHNGDSKAISVGGGWVTVGGTYTTGEVTSTAGDSLACYVEPPKNGAGQEQDASMNYLIDNIELIKKVKHTFSADSRTTLVGTAPATISGYNGDTIALPATTAFEPKDDRWEITGWTDGENYYMPGEEITVDGAKNFTPYLETEYNVFNISFSSEQTGVTLPRAFDMFEGDIVDLTTSEYQPSKLGYWFDGWSVKGSDEIITSLTVTEDTELVANFTLVTEWDFRKKAHFDQLNADKCTIEYSPTSGVIVTPTNMDNIIKPLNQMIINAADYGTIEMVFDKNITSFVSESTRSLVLRYTEPSNPHGWNEAKTIRDCKFDRYEGENGIVFRYDMTTKDTWKGDIGYFRIDPVDSMDKWALIRLTLIPSEDIEAVEITDLDEPELRTEPDTTVSVPADADYTVQSVTWTPAVESIFAHDTAYTANVTLKSNPGCRFTAETTATINGTTVPLIINADKTATVSYKFAATASLAEVTVTADKSVTTIEGENTLDLSATVATVNPDDTIDTDAVTWGVDNESIAVVEGNVLKPLDNGTVKVTATSVYDPTKTDSFTVTISGLTLYTVTFNAGTTATVTNLPDSIRCRRDVDLKSIAAPKRDGYIFLGWKTATYAEETVNSIFVEEDTTLYATWAEGVIYDFYTIPSEIKFNKFDVEHDPVAGTVKLTTNTDDPQIEINKAYNASTKTGGVVDGRKFSKIEVRLASSVACNVGTYFTSVDADTGNYVSAGYGTSPTQYLASWKSGTSGGGSLDSFFTSVIDYSAYTPWTTGIINSIRMDPPDTEGNVYIVDYIRMMNIVEEYVDIAAIDAPAVMAEAATTAEALAAGKFEVKKVEWDKELFEGKYFYDNTVYTAKITVAPKAGTKVSETAVATVGGKAATLSDNGDGTYLVTYTYPATEDLTDVKVVIDETNNAITTADGKLTLSAEVLDVETNEPISEQGIVWTATGSVDGSFSIDGNVLTAIYDDNDVTVTATSVYDRTKSASYKITISNQIPPYTLKFQNGTNGVVTNLPSEYKGKGTVKLSQFKKPVREGFSFLGWMTDPRGTETVDSIVLNKDTTLVAKWVSGLVFEFNTDGDAEGWKANTPSHFSELGVKDGSLNFTSAVGDNQLYLTDINLNADVHKKIEVRISSNTASSFELFFKSTYCSNYAGGAANSTGAGYSATGAGKYTIVTFDMSKVANWRGTVSSIRLDPSTKAGVSAKIDYIRIVEDVNEYVDITGITAPVAKAVADTSAVSADTSKYIVKSVSWSPALLYNEYHNGDTAYTVTVKVAAANGAILSDGPYATINGKTATTKANSDGTVDVSYTFTKTASIENTDAIDVNLVLKKDGNPYTKTKKVFVGDKMTIDFSLVENIAGGVRWVGWAEVDGDPSTIFEGEFTAESGKNRTFYAQYEDVLGFDYTNKYHQNRNAAYNAKLTFSEGAAVVTPNSATADARLATDTMHLLTTDYAYAEVVFDAALSTGITVDSEPSLYFSYYTATTAFANERNGKLISAEEIEDDGRKAIKFTYDLASNDNWKGYIGKFAIDPYNGTPAWAVRSIKLIPTEYTNEPINITGIVAPETWETPNTAVDKGTNFTVKSVTWDTSDLNDAGAYKPETAYSVTVVVKPETGYKFNPEDVAPVTINGATVTSVTVNTDDNTITAVGTFPATLPFKDIEVTVSGPATIAKAGRYETYKYTIETVDGSALPMNKATFGISKILDGNGDEVAQADYDEYATFDTATSRLYPLLNSTVTIRATSVYNPAEYGEITVVVTNQREQHLVTYDLNTTDAVTGSAPAPEYASGAFTPSNCTATRDGYFFSGWSLEPDDANTVSTVNVTGATTLYAIWGKGISYDFTTSAIPSEIRFNRFDVLHDTDAGVITITANGNDPQMNINKAYSSASKTGGVADGRVYKKVVVRVSSEKLSTSWSMYFTSVNPENDKEAVSPGYSSSNPGPYVSTFKSQALSGGSLDDFTIVTFDYSSFTPWTTGIVNSVRMDPPDTAGNAYAIDYIRFISDNREVVFNANGGAIDNGETYKMTADVGTNSVPFTPTRVGYAFMGWCKSADGTGKLYGGNTVKVVDDTTFYAIWAPSADLSDESSVTTEDEADAENITVTADEDKLSITTSANAAPVIAIADAMTVDASSNTLLIKLDYSYNSMTDDKMYIKFTAGGTEYTEEIKTGLASKLDTDYISADLSGIADFSGDVENVSLVLPEGKINSLNIYELSLTSAALAESAIESFYTGDMGVSSPEVTIGNGDDGSDPKTYAPTTQPENPAGTVGGGSQLGGSVGTNKNDVAGGTGSGTTMKVPEATGNNTGTGTGTGTTTPVVSTPAIENNFKYINEFKAGTFTDVVSSDWFYGDVEKSYKLGLMNGVGGTTFDPNGSVTIAQAITVAARIHSTCVKKSVPDAKSGEQWYTPYVNYAIDAKIITKGQFADYTAKATRKQVAQIFANCSPAGWLNTINMFNSIPDVTSTDAAFSAILSLYNAGILTGIDATYKFNPNADIKRSEMSAIINRVAIPESRIRVVTDVEKNEAAWIGLTTCEDTAKSGFYVTQTNNSLTVVDDPTNPDNKVFKIDTVKDSKIWSYIWHKMRLKGGETYKIEFDIYLVSAYNGAAVTETNIGLNFRYGNKDHGFGAGKIAPGKWVHVSKERKIEDGYTFTAGDMFGIYLDPVDDKGCVYLVDNLSVIPASGSASIGSSTGSSSGSTATVTPSANSVNSIKFTSADDFKAYNVDGLTVNGSFKGKSTTDDANVVYKTKVNLNASEIKTIKITAKIPKGKSAEIFFTTDAEKGLSGDKRYGFSSTSDDVATYTIDTSKCAKWTGTILEFRFDPVVGAGLNFEWLAIEFCK